jgi:hypothetical protein
VALWLVLGLGSTHAACDGELPLFERAMASAGGRSGDDGGGPGGDNTGSSATGGSGAFAGSGAAGDDSGGGAFLLVDDFEDRDTRAAGALGWWYRTNDGTETQAWTIESVSDRPSGEVALSTRGEAFTGWGAILGVNLKGEAFVDVTGFGALRFWARSGPDAVRAVRVRLLDAEGVSSEQVVTLSETWAEYRLLLAEFGGTGAVVANLSALASVQFAFPPNERFEFWIDDVAFE